MGPPGYFWGKSSEYCSIWLVKYLFSIIFQWNTFSRVGEISFHLVSTSRLLGSFFYWEGMRVRFLLFHSISLYGNAFLGFIRVDRDQGWETSSGFWGVFFFVGSCYPPEYLGWFFLPCPHDLRLLFQRGWTTKKTPTRRCEFHIVAGCVSDVFWEEPVEFQVVSLLWISNDFCMLPSRFCWLLPNFTGWFSYRSDFFRLKKSIFAGK